MIRKGLTLVGSWHYNLKYTPKLMDMITHCGVDLDLLISHHFSLSEVQKAWELQASGQCAKVLLHPWMKK
jgi:L-iditol 2-dehydrogenase